MFHFNSGTNVGGHRMCIFSTVLLIVSAIHFTSLSSSNSLCHHWADHCVGRVCSVLEEWYWWNIDR